MAQNTFKIKWRRLPVDLGLQFFFVFCAYLKCVIFCSALHVINRKIKQSIARGLHTDFQYFVQYR